MPPAKSSRNHDDPKADGPNSKEKGGNGHSSTKMRRGASQQNHSHLREVTNAAAIPPPQPATEPSPPSLQWTTFEARHPPCLPSRASPEHPELLLEPLPSMDSLATERNWPPFPNHGSTPASSSPEQGQACSGRAQAF
ncbi:hypothetical protein NW754_001076 [Fusarium falciforme]|nr:hypothetical protein NW754_001076 [Fusarium falciforme]